MGRRKSSVETREVRELLCRYFEFSIENMKLINFFDQLRRQILIPQNLLRLISRRGKLSFVAFTHPEAIWSHPIQSGEFVWMQLQLAYSRTIEPTILQWLLIRRPRGHPAVAKKQLRVVL